MTQSFTTSCVSHNVRCQPAQKKKSKPPPFPLPEFFNPRWRTSDFVPHARRRKRRRGGGGILSWLPQPVSGRRYTAGGMIISRIARRNARTKCFLIGGKGDVAQLKNFVDSFALRVVFRSQVLFLVPSRSRHPFMSYCSW